MTLRNLAFPSDIVPENFWCRAYNIKCIIDLHAAPGSQNGMEHSASRDGFTGWPSPDYISQTLDVIDFLASRYNLQSAQIIGLLRYSHCSELSACSFKYLSKVSDFLWLVLSIKSSHTFIEMLFYLGIILVLWG